MAETTETVALPEVSDSELFREARDEQPQVEETPAQAAERQRDEKGRFVKAQGEEPAAAPPQPAPTEAQPQAEAQPPEVQEEGGQVPSWRLREEREARQAAEAKAQSDSQRNYQLQSELQALRNDLQRMQAPKQEPVDFFADPDKAIQQHLQELRQEIAQQKQDMRLWSSRNTILATEGPKAVAEMEQAVADAMAKNHPDMAMLAMQMRASDDPANVAMRWYKNHRLVEVTGGDPDAYEKRILEKAKNDPKHIAEVMEIARTQAGANGSRPAVNLPPSLNKATGTGGSQASDDGDMSDRALFKNALAR